MKRLALAVSVLSLFGCMTPCVKVLSKPGSEAVRIFYKSDPPPSCKEIKAIEIVDGNGCDQPMGGGGQRGCYDGAFQQLRNAVVDAGGNAVLVREEAPAGSPCGKNGSSLEYRIFAAIYSCPNDVIQSGAK